MNDLIRKTTVEDDKVYSQTIQDVSSIAEFNKQMRNATPETGKYKGNLVHAGKIPLAFIEKMQNGQCCSDGTTYNLMSPDVEEKRRALVHLQSEHKEWMVIEGTPFARKRNKWQ